ncbi:MAG: response regulator [Pirellulales bacterium]
MARQGWLTWWLSLGIFVVLSAPAFTETTEGKKRSSPLDPFQWAVVDSLRYPKRTTPQELLEAAIRAASVEALDPTTNFLEQFDQAFEKEPDKEATLAQLGEFFQTAELSRLERFLKHAAHPEQADAIAFLIDGMLDAAQRRRTDVSRLKQAAVDLSSDNVFARQQAATTLIEGGTYALPMLVEILMETVPALNETPLSEADFRTRTLAETIIEDSGERGVRALTAWLGSDDFQRFPGIIYALHILVDSGCLPAGKKTNPDAVANLDLASVLFTPAFAPVFAAATREAAFQLLVKLEEQGHTDFGGKPLTHDLACQMLTTKLDQLLTPAGIPIPDSLTEGEASGTSPRPTVEQYLWVAQTSRPEIRYLPPVACRSLRAGHIARDLSGLGCVHPRTVRLVLLAQSEALLVFQSDHFSALNSLSSKALTETLSGPDGFSTELVAQVLDDALDRSMQLAAAVSARAIREVPTNKPATISTIRPPLVRALSAPSALVQFEASQTLATVSPHLPFTGSSRLFDRLLYFASSSGTDQVIITHPNHDIVELLRSSISQFGFEASIASSGRSCIQWIHQSPDVQLVILSARLPDLSAPEVIQLLQQESLGEHLPVLVILDPLDDDKACRRRTRLVLSLADFDNALLTDRLDSQFFPTVHQPGTADESISPPRFEETLTRIAGPQAIDRSWRQAQANHRLQRAHIALDTLAQLSTRGWDVRAACSVAQNGLRHAKTFEPALRLLANIPSPNAQQALFDLAWAPDLGKNVREMAVRALGESIQFHGILLTNSTLRIVNDMYNSLSRGGDSSIDHSLVALFRLPRQSAAADAQETN